MKKMFLIPLMILAVAGCGTGTEDPVNPTAPSAPEKVELRSAAETSLTFQWSAVEGAVAYEWQLQEGSSVVKDGKVNQRNVQITGLTKATDYRFGVCAVGSGDLKSAYSYADARTAGEITPDPPKVDYASFNIPSWEEDGVARAFPGAEGGGMYATGGRGGKVIHVTNLKDKGTGSLRAAIEEKGARTIVFDVSGIIELQSILEVKNGDVTIAGQTAPGDGICLKNYPFRINASNVIVRFIRCRMGDEKKTEDDAMNLYTGDNNLGNVIIDHCSLSWSTDECGTFYGMTNFTLQWCVLSESLLNSVHGKGKHGYGGIWGGTNATYHHNLLAHHYSRNPRLDHDYVSTLKGPVSLVNNVIYNWGDNSTYGGESANDNGEFKQYNLINNYYKPGPATAPGKYRFIDPWTGACNNCSKKMGTSTIVPGHFYMSGNVFSTNDEWSADNWKGTTASDAVIVAIKSASAFTYSEQPSSLSLHSAENAFTTVLSYAGASLKRDAVDERIARETKEGTFTYKGSKGGDNGFIDTPSDVGGWPEYKEETGGAFPDWVGDPSAYTLDPEKRYTNLEMYLHYLVKDIVAGQNAGATYGNL